MIKKTPGILPSSASIYFSQHMRTLGLGYDAKINWIASSGFFMVTMLQNCFFLYLSLAGIKISLRVRGSSMASLIFLRIYFSLPLEQGTIS
jgi:hypothetical protein